MIAWLVAAAGLGHAGDTPLVDETVLTDPVPGVGGQFGWSVAVDGAVAVVGSPSADHASVLVRVAGEWIYTDILRASDDSASFDFDGFGQSVAVSGDTIVIGAPRADVNFVPNQNQGAAYVFRRDPGTGDWFEQAKLTGFDSVAADQFGRSVAIDGDLIVVGSNLVSVDGQEQRGAGYVFRRSPSTDTWIQEAKLVAPDGQSASEFFGSSVAVSGQTIAAGSWGTDVTFQDQGAVYVFRFIPATGQWFWEDKLLAADAEQGAGLGSSDKSVAIQGDLIVAGAPGQGLFNAGAAYVFRREVVGPQQVVWVQEARLAPFDEDSSDRFGFSVALSGGSMLIGAPDADDAGVSRRGAGYFFTRSPGGVWSFRQQLVAAGDQPFEFGGRSVALSSTSALLGRQFSEIDGTNRGAVSMWSCGDVIFADGGEDFSGCGL